MESRMRNSFGMVRDMREQMRQSADHLVEALEQAVSQDCTSHSEIDDVLRSYLGLVAGSKGQSNA